MNRIFEAIGNCIDLFRILFVVIVCIVFFVMIGGLFKYWMDVFKEKVHKIQNKKIPCNICEFRNNKNIFTKSCTGGFMDKYGCTIKRDYMKRGNGSC